MRLRGVGLLRMRGGAERRRATRWIGTILLLAVAGGAALTAAEAARRTDTAFRRALATSRASDVVVNANAFGKNAAQTRRLRTESLAVLDALHKCPVVVAHGLYGGANIFRVADGRVDPRLSTGSALGLVAYDNDIGRTISEYRIESGRPAAVDRADEITINPKAADITGWRTGQTVTDLREYDFADLDPATGGPRPDHGTHLTLHVVGVVEQPEDFMIAPSERLPRIFLTPAFGRQFPESVFYFADRVRLRNGDADLPALRAAVNDAGRAAPDVSLPIAPTDEGLRKVERANDPLVKGLWILVALAALVGILLAAQSLGRALASRANEQAQYRALGATRSQRFALEIGTVALVALVAAVLAGVLGWLFSALTPVGAARGVEPNPGFSLNLGLTVVVVSAIFAGTMLAALPRVVRLATARNVPGPIAVDGSESRSRIADLEAKAGMSAPAVIGTQLAFQSGRGPSATPVRSVLASLVLVVAVVTATFAFGTNLQRWTTTPRLYGWAWDAAAGNRFGAIPPEFVDGIQHFPNVVAASALNSGELTLDGHVVPGIGIDVKRGSVTPDINSGRLPTTATEVALGARTMRLLHTHIGGTVTATIGKAHPVLTVVGRTTFPEFGNGRFGETGLGTGVLGTAALFPVHDESTPGGKYSYMLVRFAPGTATASTAQLRDFLAQNGCPDPTCVITDSRPAEIDGYRNARGLPRAISVVLLLFLLAALAHVLISTMQRRSSDLAVLRALGCTPRNLVSTLRWQSVILTGTALVVGIPIGLLAGRFAWNTFSTNLGIAPGTSWPIAFLAWGSLAMLVLAAALATGVGRRVSSRIREPRFSN